MIKAFLSLFSGNLFSKILGLIREALLAWAFGLSATAAAIRIAIAAIFVPMNLLTQDLLAAGYLPLYNEYKKQDPILAKQYAQFFTLLMLLIGFSITITLWPIAQAWISLLASGLTPDTQALAAKLFRILLLGVPFILTASAATYALMAEGRYSLQSLRPSMQNLGLIAGILLSSFTDSLLSIAWAYVSSQILFCAIAIWQVRYRVSTKTNRMLPWRKFSNALWTVIKPLLVLPLALQGYIILERNVASWLGESTIAALEISKFISETSMALLAVPMGLVLLSRYTTEDEERSSQIIQQILIVLTLLITPVATVLITYPEVIVQLLFQRGAFTPEDTELTSHVLRLFGAGLLIHTLNYQLLKLANAFQRSKDFAIASLIGIAAGAIGLLNYRTLGELTFGTAYILYGTGTLLYLSYQLRCTLKISRQLSYVLLWLFIARIVTKGLGIDSFTFKIFAAAGVTAVAIIIIALPYIFTHRTLDIKQWSKSDTR
ncbi:MAG: lipid II flippase MurJ [Reinekea sp.]